MLPPLAEEPQLAPCASSGRAWRLWVARHSQSEARPLGPQPPPRGLQRAASKVADFTALDNLGPASAVADAGRAVALEPRSALNFHCQGRALHQSHLLAEAVLTLQLTTTLQRKYLTNAAVITTTGLELGLGHLLLGVLAICCLLLHASTPPCLPYLTLPPYLTLGRGTPLGHALWHRWRGSMVKVPPW